MEINQVIQGDCLKLLELLPDSSVDLICTDPPYYNVKKSKWWDRQWRSPDEFLYWLRAIAIEWQRVLKPNGSLYCFASTKMAARVEVVLGELFNVLSNIRWQKDAGFHKTSSKEALRDFFNASESIIFCEHYGADNIAKGDAGYGAKCDELRGFVFEPLRAYLDGERVKAGFTVRQIAEAFQRKTGSRTVTGMAGHWFTSVQWTLPTKENYTWLKGLFGPDSLRQQYEELRQQYEELRRPFNVSADVPYTDVWTFPTVQSYKGKHPCEKPAAMIEHIISASSRPGALVLDCFGGSGSTAIAAKKLGRNYQLFEIDPHWVNIANHRLGNTQQLPEAPQKAIAFNKYGHQLSLMDLLAN